LQAFIEKHRRQVFQPVLQSVFCILVTPQTLARQNLLEVKKQVMITWCKVRIVLKMLENFPNELFEECACMGGSVSLHKCGAFFEQPTPFPHIPFVHCNFIIHFQQPAFKFPPDEHF
jgi:hypothetical protein